MANTYTLIASNTLSSNAASVTFSGIPGTYTDLVLRVCARNNRAFYTTDMFMRINGSSSSVYSQTYLFGNGASVFSGRYTNATYLAVGSSPGANATSNTFGNFEIYIPNYTSSSQKPLSGTGGGENNATDTITQATANLANITSAITEIQLYNDSSANFVSGSSFWLYGIKNS